MDNNDNDRNLEWVDAGHGAPFDAKPVAHAKVVRERVKRFATLLPKLAEEVVQKSPTSRKRLPRPSRSSARSFSLGGAVGMAGLTGMAGLSFSRPCARQSAPRIKVDAVYVAGGFLAQCVTEEGQMEVLWPESDIDYWLHVVDGEARLSVAELVRVVAPNATKVCVNKCTLRLTLPGSDTQHNIILFSGPAHEVPAHFDMDCVKAAYEATSGTLTYTPEFLESVDRGLCTLSDVPFDQLSRESQRRVRKYEARGFRYPGGGVTPAADGEEKDEERKPLYTMCGRSALQSKVKVKPMRRVGCGNYFKPSPAAATDADAVSPRDPSLVQYRPSGQFHVSTNFTGHLRGVELVRVYENDKSDPNPKATRRYVVRVSPEQRALLDPYVKRAVDDTFCVLVAPRLWHVEVKPGDKLDVSFRLLTRGPDNKHPGFLAGEIQVV